MRSRKAGFPFATRARKREPCLQTSEVRIENELDRTFSKSIFFQSFSGRNHFSPRFMVPCSLLAENIFTVFRSPHLPLDTPRKASFPVATRARKREPCPQRYASRMIRTENFLSQIFFKVFWNHFSPRFLVPFTLLAENIFSVFRSLQLSLDTLIKKSSYSWTNQKVQL